MAYEALDLLMLAIKNAGHEGKIKLGLDAAASEFFQDGKYNLDFKSAQPDPKMLLSDTQLTDMYLDLLKKYPLILLEDPFAEDDWAAWTHFAARARTQIVADDLTVTSPKRIKIAIEKKAANALLLKVNQIGTVSESIAAYVFFQQCTDAC